MDKLAYQKARRATEVGLGAVIGGGGRSGPLVAPPPTSPYWKSVPPVGLFALFFDAAARAAYQASVESLTQGTTGPILWRTWQFKGIWYATSRANTSSPVTFYVFNPAMKVPHAGAAGVGKPEDKQGLGDLHANVAPYLDDQGMLDVDSFGYDLGVGVAPPLDLHRWGAVPVSPSANSPLWRDLTPAEMTSLQATTGWSQAVSVASSTHTVIFKFQNTWYMATQKGFKILGRGSSPGNRYLAGVGRRDAGRSSRGFGAPTAAHWQKAPPSSAIANAAIALLTSHSAFGRVMPPAAEAFRAAYNAEKAVALAGVGAELREYGYGPNTRDALQSLIEATASGGKAPGLGQTNPLFAPPSTLTAQTMGTALAAALQAMLADFNANGVPSEHSASATTGAFQTAWNKDPLVAAVGGNALLSVDESYGPNTALATATVNGGSAPTVNTSTPSTSPTTPTTPPTTPSTTPPDYTIPIVVGSVLGGAVIITGAWWLATRPPEHPMHPSRLLGRHKHPAPA
jgi:hypothetical protein